MERKTLKGKLKVIAIDYGAPGIPDSVAALQPSLYQEGNGYMAWYEGSGKKYYGFGNSPQAAMRDFDTCYQHTQRKKQVPAEAVIEEKPDPLLLYTREKWQHLMARLKNMPVYPLHRSLRKT